MREDWDYMAARGAVPRSPGSPRAEDVIRTGRQDMMVSFPAYAVEVSYVLEAQLSEDPEGGWHVMGGFSYGSEEELRDCYDAHFAAIEGKGCNYRLTKVERAERVTVIS